MRKELNTKNQDKLLEIQSILTGDSQSILKKNIEKINNTLHDPKHFGDFLDKAVKHNISKKPEALSKELFTTVESGLTKSIQNNPKKITDIIAPIIAPAIRRSVAETMKNFIESTNQIIEASLSPTSLKWRLQSIISGKSYSDIVFANSVEYRVDYVFLINKQSGILIDHAESASRLKLEKDEDLVTGMLTAIRDFSKDVFNSNTSKNTSNLHKLELGNQTIVIEDGTHVFIAAVIIGIPPRSLSTTMKEIIEEINLKISRHDNLELFFHNKKIEIQSILQKGLLSKETNVNPRTKNKKTFSKLITYTLLATLMIFLLSFAGLFILKKYNHASTIKQTKNYIKSLNKQPGLLITNFSVIENDIIISGLKDSFATLPVNKNFKTLKKRTNFIWKTYISTDPSVLAKRIKSQLNLSNKILFKYDANELKVIGDISNFTRSQIQNTLKFYLNDMNISFMNTDYSLKKEKKSGG